jgi:hypothetical protein
MDPYSTREFYLVPPLPPPERVRAYRLIHFTENISIDYDAVNGYRIEVEIVEIVETFYLFLIQVTDSVCNLKLEHRRIDVTK